MDYGVAWDNEYFSLDWRILAFAAAAAQSASSPTGTHSAPGTRACAHASRAREIADMFGKKA